MWFAIGYPLPCLAIAPQRPQGAALGALRACPATLPAAHIKGPQAGLKCSLQQRLQMFRRARSISCLEEICRLVVYRLPLSFSDASTTVFRSFNLNDVETFDFVRGSIHTDILEA